MKYSHHEKQAGNVTFEIVEQIAVIGDSYAGYQKELNLVSWNGHEAKYDIREWNDDHTRMKKGITLTYNELYELSEQIDEYLKNR